MKICLVCSSGGHFLQLYSLRELWSRHECFWISFSKYDTSHLLKGEKVYWAFYPTNRNIKNLVRNLYLAMRILVSERPGVIVSSGAGVAVPFIYIGNILGIRTIYIESLTRAEDLSLSGKLIYPIADVLLVQWPQLCSKYAKAVFKGQII